MRVPSRLFAETYAKIGDARATGAALGMEWGAVRTALSRLRAADKPKQPKPARVFANVCGACKTPIRSYSTKRKYCFACCPARRFTPEERVAVEAAYQMGDPYWVIAERHNRTIGSIASVVHAARKAGRCGRRYPGPQSDD